MAEEREKELKEGRKLALQLAAHLFEESRKNPDPELAEALEFSAMLLVVTSDADINGLNTLSEPKQAAYVERILDWSDSLLEKGISNKKTFAATALSIGFSMGYAYHKRFGDLWELPPWEPGEAEDAERAEVCEQCGMPGHCAECENEAAGMEGGDHKDNSS